MFPEQTPDSPPSNPEDLLTPEVMVANLTGIAQQRLDAYEAPTCPTGNGDSRIISGNLLVSGQSFSLTENQSPDGMPTSYVLTTGIHMGDVYRKRFGRHETLIGHYQYEWEEGSTEVRYVKVYDHAKAKPLVTHLTDVTGISEAITEIENRIPPQKPPKDQPPTLGSVALGGLY